MGLVGIKKKLDECVKVASCHRASGNVPRVCLMFAVNGEQSYCDRPDCSQQFEEAIGIEVNIFNLTNFKVQCMYVTIE